MAVFYPFTQTLIDLSNLSPTDNSVIIGNGTNFVLESGSTLLNSIGLGPISSPQFASIELGHASDTTITRLSAGVVQIEGSTILTAAAIGSTVQAYDSDLTAWAGVNPSSYSTTAQIAAAYQPLDSDLTSIAALTTTTFGRSVLTESSASTLRTTLGVTATGSDTTYAYRANNLSDLASASTARTNLGLGTAAVKNTGTSGNNIPLLDGANEWGAIQRFGTVGNNGPKFNNPYWAWMDAAGTRKAYIQAVSAGTLTIQPESNTVGVRINVNGGAATVEGDTIATLTATQTLSNKTLSSPLFSGSAGSALTFAQGYGPNFANSGATHGIFDYNNTTFIMTYNTSDWKTSVRLLSTSMQLYANNGLATWDGSAFFVGDGSAIASLRINGTASGTNGGGFLGVYNNGTTIAAFGNYSSIIGGTYDATMLFYIASSSIKFRVGGSVEWLNVNSSGTAAFGSAITVTGAVSCLTATDGVVWYNGSGSYRWIGGVRSDITGNTDDFVLYNSAGGTALTAKHSNNNIIFAKPPKLPVYTLATLPSASTYGEGSILYVSDQSTGFKILYSSGSAWVSSGGLS